MRTLVSAKASIKRLEILLLVRTTRALVAKFDTPLKRPNAAGDRLVLKKIKLIELKTYIIRGRKSSIVNARSKT